jgi:hypothetical protein
MDQIVPTVMLCDIVVDELDRVIAQYAQYQIGLGRTLLQLECIAREPDIVEVPCQQKLYGIQGPGIAEQVDQISGGNGNLTRVMVLNTPANRLLETGFGCS